MSISGSRKGVLGELERGFQVGTIRPLVVPPTQKTRERSEARGPLRVAAFHEREGRFGEGDCTVKVRPVSRGTITAPSLTKCNCEISDPRRPFESGLRGIHQCFFSIVDSIVEVLASPAPGEPRPEALRKVCHPGRSFRAFWKGPGYR